LEDADSIFLGAFTHQIERPIQDALGKALLAVVHHGVDELRHRPILEFRIGQHLSPLDLTFTWHGCGTPGLRPDGDLPVPPDAARSLRSFRSVLRAALTPILGTDRVESAADNVVADAGEVLHTAAANEDDRVLLEVVTHPGDVGRHLDAVGEPHARNLPE